MSFNKITVIGNLGRDPELRYTPQGNAVCDFSIAVNDRKRDKAGELQDHTTWFKVTFWDKKAEIASKYLTKGRQIYVEGRLQVEEWSDRDGNNRYSLVIQGSELHFLGEKGGAEMSSNSNPASDSNFDDNANDNTSDLSREKNLPAPNDDDIPF